VPPFREFLDVSDHFDIARINEQLRFSRPIKRA
jgi:hypothetical protein